MPSRNTEITHNITRSGIALAAPPLGLTLSYIESPVEHTHAMLLRGGGDLAVRETGVQVALEIRGPEHADLLLHAARVDGYDVTAITGR